MNIHFYAAKGGRMAKKALEAVLAAEEEARQLLRQARAEATQTVEEARASAATKKAQLISAAEEEARALDEAAMRAGEEDGRPNMEQSKKLAAKYEAVSNADLSSAVDKVIEKVVQYGNS
jgi:vacuolar-type H+-ATPase subunit H